jgi:hypothetical protein
MPGDSGVTVVTMLVCSFYFACEAAGASSARHSLRPLIFQGQDFQANLARIARRDRETVSAVIARSDLSAVAQRAKAEATKQSIAAFLSYLWIASLRSQ